jgi:hypothetical protein
LLLGVPVAKIPPLVNVWVVNAEPLRLNVITCPVGTQVVATFPGGREEEFEVAVKLEEQSPRSLSVIVLIVEEFRLSRRQ